MVFASGVSVSGYVCMVAGCGNTVYARGLCRLIQILPDPLYGSA